MEYNIPILTVFAKPKTRQQAEKDIERAATEAPGPKCFRPSLVEALPRDLGVVEVGVRRSKRSYPVEEVLRKWNDPKVEKVAKIVLGHERRPLPIPLFLATGRIPLVEEQGAIVAFCDGSKSEGCEPSYGVYVEGLHSFSGSATNTEDIDRAEALASIHAVLIALQAQRAEVFTDSAYVELLWNKKLEGGKKEANSDLIPIIAEVLSQASRTGRSVVVRKVFSHVMDHRNKAECERRMGWMKQTYPERFSELIEGDYRADRLAGAGPKGCSYYLPPHLTLVPTTYLAAKGGWVRSLRAHMRGVYQVTLEKEVGGKLTCFKWMRKDAQELVDSHRTNDIMTCRTYKVARLVAFMMQMRRKDLRENGPYMGKAHNTFFRS